MSESWGTEGGGTGQSREMCSVPPQPRPLIEIKFGLLLLPPSIFFFYPSIAPHPPRPKLTDTRTHLFFVWHIL